MKNYVLHLFIIITSVIAAQTPCTGGMAGSFPCDGLDLQSSISLATMGAGLANDSWGWTDPMDGKEYALVGLNNGTAFIDISVPTAPIYLGKLPTHTSSSSWRDVKTYLNHAFIVSEASGHGMQVFDLTQLRSVTSPPVTFSETAHYNQFGSAHNIVINTDSGYAYAVGTGTFSGGPHFIDISDPINPIAAGGFSADGYSHDAQVVTYSGPDTEHVGKEILIGSNTDQIAIVDITDKSNPQILSTVTYTPFGYTHQGWFTEDQRFFLLGDELDERNVGFDTRTWVFDFSDLDNVLLHYTYTGPTAAIDHNGYVVGNRFYLANYRAGVRIIKVDGLYDDPPTMTEVSYFDTYITSNNANFNGVWNVYPYFESGNLVVSDIERGFLLIKDPYYDNIAPTPSCQDITVTLDRITGTASISAAQLDNGSTDLPIFSPPGPALTFSIDKSTFTCEDIGTQNVTLTVEDDYGNTASCVAVVTVVAETTTYSGGIWTPDNPGLGSHVKFSQNYTTTIDNVTACSCEIDAGVILTVEGNDFLDIKKDITVNGSLVIEHQGSIVQTYNDAVVTNNGNVAVNLTTPSLNARDFMIMGSPMTAEDDAMYSAYQVLNHTTANFTPYVGVPPVVGVNFHDQEFDDWSNHTGVLTPGEGYLVRPSYTSGGTYNYVYDQGTLNNGVVTYPAEFGDNKEDSPNVLSNPYASAIDADLFIGANPIVDEVYFWEHLTTPAAGIPGPLGENFSMEDISMYNLSGGTPAANGGGTPNDVISTGQGFGIKANSAGDVTFNNSMRLTSGNTTLRRPIEKDLIWLTVRDSQYHMGSTTLIGFMETATSELDEGYDSMKLGTVVSLYSHLEDGSELLGIQGRESFDVSKQIPMGFSTMIDPDSAIPYTISISDIEGSNIEQATVYLVDHLENTITNLSESDYTFLSDAATYDNRFTLQFEPEATSGTSETALEQLSIYPNPTQDVLTIVSPKAEVKSVIVYDVRGRVVAENLFTTQGNYQIDLSKLETAMYFVKITTESGSLTKRVLKQ